MATPTIIPGVPPRKAAGAPVIIGAGGMSAPLEKVSLDKGEYTEDWLQHLAHAHPEVLPIPQIEPGFGEIYAVAREVPCAHGSIDNLFITAAGDLVLVEAKLWRNPQARREVVAQALDYVAALSTMSYDAFEVACRKGRGFSGTGLHAHVADKPDALDEAEFIDAVSRNLRRGRMLVIALGDGIRAEAEALVDLLQSHAGAHFTFALVELATWRNPATGDLIALPSTLAQTVMITRGIVTVENGAALIKPVAASSPEARPSSISEELYFEELAKRDPAMPAALRAFLTRLEPLGVYADLKASLNLKAELPGRSKPVNFGYITKSGKLSTDTLSWTTSDEIAIPYNKALARLIGGVVGTTSSGHSFVSTNGTSTPKVSDLLPAHAEAWANAIAETIDDLNGTRRPATPVAEFGVEAGETPSRASIMADAWALVAEVIQRHPRQGCLRVIEMRPGGGQSHVLGLFEMEQPNALIYRDKATPLADFNLLSGCWAAHADPSFPRWRPCREAEGTWTALNSLLQALDLEEHAEPVERTVSGLVFVAAILNAPWGRARELSTTMGFCDTSGDGADIRRELLQFPALYRPEEQMGEGWREGLATGYWLIGSDASSELLGCIRTNGQLSTLKDPTQVIELSQAYSERCSIADVLGVAEASFGGAR
jgi:hypothetical protein